MGLETLSSVEIKERFHKDGKPIPSFHWAYGTMFIDTEDQRDLDTIKEVMVNEVLAPGCTVLFSELKPTETEPWTQWSMDVVSGTHHDRV